MEDALVLELTEFGRGDVRVAGGKGANLGELMRLGLNVPPGFVVTTAAYEWFVAENGLEAVIEEAMGDGTEDVADLANGGAAIRAAFNEGVVPEGVASAILAAYEQLGSGAVAVRSSATAEDLPEAAFAGQQETFLNVMGGAALLEAMRCCWASLWTERAIAYRQRQGMEEADIAMAVVVQRMAGKLTAPARWVPDAMPAALAGSLPVSGVMFTANPVTGVRDETVIDASPGLGEAVVSGQVTPDQFVLRRRRGRWRVAQRREGQRELVVRALAEGGTEEIRGADVADWPTLPEATLQQLAALGAQIEAHFGMPQDVEWLWDGEELFILQARPITALPEPAPRVSRVVRLLAGIFAEMLPARPYPLEATTWGPDLMWSSFIVPFMGLLGLRALPTEVLLEEEDDIIVRFKPRTPLRPTPGILLAPWRLLRLARRHDPLRWQSDVLLAEARSLTSHLNGRNLEELSWDALVGTVYEALTVPRLIFELRFRYLPRGMLATALLRLLLALNRRGELAGTLLLTGLETKTLEANRALEELAADIRGDATLSHTFARNEADKLWAVLKEKPQGRVFLTDLGAFLDEFGHREAGGTMLLSQETWRDAPEVVLGALKGMATHASQRFHGAERFEEARAEALGGRLMWLPGARRLFSAALRQARTFMQVREDTRFYATLVMPVLRQALLEMGQRLQAEGVLDEAQEVFYLRMEELEALVVRWPPEEERAAEIGALVQWRKEKWAALEDIPLIDPRLYRRTGKRGAGRQALLQGTPGSPGVAQGPVRVVRNGSEFGKLRPGDVLVAPYTNPAWTPLFQQAAAVVVDTGSAASHAAITAREYGIPAVMATMDGTEKLWDGQVVRVDGGRGVVEVGEIGD